MAGVNYVDFLGNLESILKSSTIPEDVRTDTRSIAASPLWNKNATHPTTTHEKRAIYSLHRDLNITILPADKGGTTVVLDKEEYNEKAIQ